VYRRGEKKEKGDRIAIGAIGGSFFTSPVVRELDGDFWRICFQMRDDGL
jgi:hypothetical protein